jgi:type IV pilus assembly protein PilP
MKNLKPILFFATLLFPFVLILSSCDNPPPKKKVQQNANVVTKKITPQNKPVLPVATPQPEPEQKPAAPVATPQPEPEQKPAAPVATPQPEPEQKPAAPVATPEPEPEQKPATKSLKTDMEKDKAKKLFYVSEGKIDPFLSPIQKLNEKKQSKIKNRKHTPLEKLDLSQLKLVAIINMESGNKNVAMVQESSGKGYMVKVGTFIGTNSGRIIEIKSDEIIIKERMKNFKGVLEDNLKIMKLQKKSDG